MTSLQIIALVIFVITYLGIIFTRLPGVNIDRPSAAFFGAIAMIISGVVSFEEAISAIDFNTIALLLGMMIIIATLQSDGFFIWLTSKTVRFATTNRGLLTSIVLVTGIGSAFLVNDAVVLVVTPVTIILCRKFYLNPIPYLIAVILSSNAGSVMTMTGNPQNMLIGIISGMSFGKFFIHLLPVALFSMSMIITIIRILYPSEFRNRKSLEKTYHEENVPFKKMRFSVLVFVAVMILFFLSAFTGISLPLTALLGASVIMLFGATKPSEIIRKVDWVLLIFFAGLFIVIHATEKAGLLEQLKTIDFSSVSLKTNFLFHGLGLGVAQIISNVPYVIAMSPVVKPYAGDALWLILASSSTLAGNATIVGAVANLIVIETAAKDNVKITFMNFLKAGLISTIACMLISIIIIHLQIVTGLL
jgi:Na+/H+ antiporter NhaD/arsenite permease-like protein